MSRSRWAVVLVGMLVGACRTNNEPTCSERNCDGCCQGVCKPGRAQDDACGSGGDTCEDCTATGKHCVLGKCVACIPNCAGKVCGDNNCGGRCGNCNPGFACTAAGQCVA